MKFSIWDLDGTVIDSEHRKNTLPNGTLDLAHWIENNTPEKIALDSLLPLAEKMKNIGNDKNVQLVICTARVISDHDIGFLHDHGFEYSCILSRPMGLRFSDADLKEFHLRNYAHDMFMTWREFCDNAVMFDDAPTVITRMLDIGLSCIDADELNKGLLS